MKKLIVLFIMLFAAPAFGWNLFFVAQQETLSDGLTTGYKLGPTNYELPVAQVLNVKTVGTTHMFMYHTQDDSIANVVKDWSEFRGFGYIDMVMRVAQGLSNGTLSEIEYVTGAHWYTGGSWHFGTVKDWKAAGSPVQVWFGKYIDIFGMEIE